MSTRINLNLVHPFFNEPLCVGIEWTLPFLPRVGESISPWIWIEARKINLSDIEKLLTEEAKDSLKAERFSLEDWLYEVGLECNCIYSISYYKNDKVNSHEIYVHMYLNKNGKSR